MRNIYLDYNSSTPCDERVVKAMNPYWSQFGNPHSHHYYGKHKQMLIDGCLERLSGIYNCLPEDIIFTSGATEANNLAIFSGIRLALQRNPHKNVILTSHLEHKSVLNPLRCIANELGLILVFVKITTDGVLDLMDFHEKLSSYSVLWLSACMTNGEIGTNQPIRELAVACNQYGVTMHVDASQGAYCDIDFDALEIDYLTISGHKIYGPCGIGLLISRNLQEELFPPMIYGGGQQNNFRSGTLPAPLIVGLTKAIEILSMIKEQEKRRLQELRDYLLHKLQKEFVISVHGNLKDRHPANLYISIQGVDALQLLNNMQSDVSFSLGSACNGMMREHSDLMKSLGVTKEESESSFRMAVGRYTTKEEIDYVVKKFVLAVKSLKNIFWGCA